MRPIFSVAAGRVTAGLAALIAPASARHPDRPPRTGFEAGFEAGFDRSPPPERPRAPGPFGADPSRVHPTSPLGSDRSGFERWPLLWLVGAAGRLLPRLRSRVGRRPAAPTARSAGLTPDDHRAYESIWAGVQAACNAQDLDALGELATPAMVERFADRFARDVYSVAGDVRLRRMRPVRVWSEGGLDRATIALRYSMTDVVCDGYGRVVYGACAGRVTVEESWTYVRHGRWLLEAIQRESGTRDRVSCVAVPRGRPVRATPESTPTHAARIAAGSAPPSGG